MSVDSKDGHNGGGETESGKERKIAKDVLRYRHRSNVHLWATP